jgi:uncharacterized membrane protein
MRGCRIGREREPHAHGCTPHDRTAGTALRVPGILLGLGALLDGIGLHQILQWHHLLSSEYPVDTVDGLRMNTL